MSADMDAHSTSRIPDRSASGQRIGCTNSQWTYVRANMDLLEDWPFALGDTFAHADVPETFQGEVFRGLHNRNLIEKVARERRPVPNSEVETRELQLYRMKPVFETLMERYASDDNRVRSPCGHSGVKNLRGSDQYTCSREDCDVRFSREAAKEVLGRGE